MGKDKLAPRKRHEWTSKKKAEFVEALAQGVTVVAAAEAVGMSRSGAYKQRESHPDFAEAWREAYEESTELLEAEAFQRAMGREEVVGVDKDGQPIFIKKYNDLLLIFLLKSRRPETYRDRMDVTVQQERRIVVDLLKVVKDPDRPGHLRMVEKDGGTAGHPHAAMEESRVSPMTWCPRSRSGMVLGDPCEGSGQGPSCDPRGRTPGGRRPPAAVGPVSPPSPSSTRRKKGGPIFLSTLILGCRRFHK